MRLYFVLWFAAWLTPRHQAKVIDTKFDEFVNGLLKEWNSPGGAAVAVVQRDSSSGEWTVEKKGYGLATVGGREITSETLFGLASNSKTFTALAVGMLVANASLSPRLFWNTKLATVIPDWGLQDSVAQAGASVLDAMTHRTGVPGNDYVYREQDTVAHLVEYQHNLRPSAGFRETWQYNNNMYAILSWLPELLLPDRIPYTEYVQQHIFGPLGMVSSSFSEREAKATGLLAQGLARDGLDLVKDPFGKAQTRVLPYFFKEDYPISKALAGAGGLISSLSDLVTFLQTLLLGGRHPETNETVIPTEVIENVSRGIVVSEGQGLYPELSVVVYGGGQSRNSYRGHELIEHGGDVFGFHSQITRFPNDNLGVIVLTNDNEYGPALMEIIKYRAIDTFFGLEPIDWDQRYKALFRGLVPPPKVNDPGDSQALSKLAGTYHNAAYGSIELCLFDSSFSDSSLLGSSAACAALLSELPKLLPGKMKEDAPSLVAVWGSFVASHVVFEHVRNQKTFDVLFYRSLPIGNDSDSFWAYGGLSNGVSAEFWVDEEDENSVMGFDIVNLWGAAPNALRPPTGETVKERAEIWFDKADKV